MKNKNYYLQLFHDSGPGRAEKNEHITPCLCLKRFFKIIAEAISTSPARQAAFLPRPRAKTKQFVSVRLDVLELQESFRFAICTI